MGISRDLRGMSRQGSKTKYTCAHAIDGNIQYQAQCNGISRCKLTFSFAYRNQRVDASCTAEDQFPITVDQTSLLRVRITSRHGMTYRGSISLWSTSTQPPRTAYRIEETSANNPFLHLDRRKLTIDTCRVTNAVSQIDL
jgi:hypothetical protein